MKRLVWKLILALQFVGIAGAGWASEGSCETNFNASGSQEKGQFFGAMRNMQGADDQSLIKSVRAVAEADGFQIGSEELVNGAPTLNFSQKASSNARGFTLRATAKGGTVLLGVGTPPGMIADPAVFRSEMCGMLSRVHAASGIGRVGRAGTDQSSRTAPPPVRSDARVVRPKATFNLDQAEAALGPGTATITGTACVARQGNTILASNYPVYLYPLTPYMEEAIGLIREMRKGKQGIEVSQIAMSTRMTGQTNANGEFRFSQMKPGKYYLMSTLSSTFRNQRDVRTGTAQSGNIGIEIYQTVEYDQTYDDLLEQVVHVKSDGEAVKVTLAPRRSLNIFKSTGNPGIFGCRW